MDDSVGSVASESGRLGARLEYAPGVSARRRLVRRVVRWGVVVLVVAGVGVGVKYWPRIKWHLEFLRLQQKCMEAELPQTESAVSWNNWETFFGDEEEHWIDLRSRLGVRKPGVLRAVVFLHERFTPSGSRRLVVVEAEPITLGSGGFTVTVVRPAGLISKAVVKGSVANWDVDPSMLMVGLNEPNAQIRPGTIDSVDRSRFWVPITVKGKERLLEFQLRDDDTVVVKTGDLAKPPETPTEKRSPPRDPLLGRPEVR